MRQAVLCAGSRRWCVCVCRGLAVSADGGLAAQRRKPAGRPVGEAGAGMAETRTQRAAEGPRGKRPVATPSVSERRKKKRRGWVGQRKELQEIRLVQSNLHSREESDPSYAYTTLPSTQTGSQARGQVILAGYVNLHKLLLMAPVGMSHERRETCGKAFADKK
ncbi:hypothetical protein FB451DRAFT_1180695 [Mycena latifolia]|nr:hypothetical protein FB451DRAFT_1180695 [Mycena latifolia]